MDSIRTFKTAEAFESWLSKNHLTSSGIWLRMYKKASGARAIKGPEMLDVLLCYGWITGQVRRGTERYVLWRVCPRRPGSIWSELNTKHVERLIREHRMKKSGMREVEEAKRDGRWARAYAPQRTAVLPKDFMKEVNRNRKAGTFLKTLTRAEVYAIIFRLYHTKEARRKEKIAGMIRMLEEGRKWH